MTEKENTVGCYLYSKANYSISIKYNGETLILPPFATKVKIADANKLESLPNMVKKVTINSPIKKQVKKEGGN